MAVDEAIAVAFSEKRVPPTLRLYQWSTPTFSIGSFQKLDRVWLDCLKQNPVAVIRRITGGRALLHDREITYSVIAGTKDPLFSEGIKGTFYTIAKGLLDALRRVGVDAAIYSPPRKQRRDRGESPLCFASTSWYEITAGGKKLIGSAQRRWISHFLQHGSLMLYRSPIENRLPTEGKRPRLTSDRQAALADLLPRLPPIYVLEQALKAGFEAALPVRFVQGHLTEEEKEIAGRLIKEKYGNKQWNLYRERAENPA